MFRSYRILHMDSIAVTQGQVVRFGDYIGDCGNTGVSTGLHAHVDCVKGHHTNQTLSSMDAGHHQADEMGLYRLVTNDFFKQPYRVTSIFEKGHKGLDVVPILPKMSVKIYWSLAVGGRVVIVRHGSPTAGHFVIIHVNDDIDGHWAEKQMTHMVALGILSGYPDGSLRPNTFMTRAEYAVAETRKL